MGDYRDGTDTGGAGDHSPAQPHEDEGGSSVRGAYPGGPRKRDEAGGVGRPTRTPDLRTAEEIDARSHEIHRRLVRKRRRKRVLIGFAVALLAAGATGFWMGVQAHRSSEEIATERNQASQQDRELIRQRNKILQQLWDMEDLENGPRPKY